MGLRNFFQTAKQDAINQLVTERADKLATELAEQMTTDRVAEARAEARAEAQDEARNGLLRELRKMSPEEITAMLEREMPAGNGANDRS